MNLLNILRVSFLASLGVANIQHATAMEQDEPWSARQLEYAKGCIKQRTKNREIPLSEEQIEEYARAALQKGQRMKAEEARKEKEKKKKGKKSETGKEYRSVGFSFRGIDKEGKPFFHAKNTLYEDGAEVWSEEQGEAPAKSKKKGKKKEQSVEIPSLYPQHSRHERGSTETRDVHAQDINELVIQFNNNLNNYVQKQLDGLYKLQRVIESSREHNKEERSPIDPNKLQDQLKAFTSCAAGSFSNTAAAARELNRHLLPQLNINLRKSGKINRKHTIGFDEEFTDFMNYIKNYSEE